MRWTDSGCIDGCGVVSYDRHEDERGYFQETWNQRELAKIGAPIPWSWAQDNSSVSYAGVIRGFHVQRHNPQGKLVTCMVGRVIDVCLDVRPRSPTFLKIARVMLDASQPKSFYLPPGTAHAFIAITDCVLNYKCTTPYDRNSDGGFNAYSPEIAMIWPPGLYVRSDKDTALPMLMDYVRTLD